VPNPIHITDSRDPRVAAYLQVRERDLTGRGDRFIVEGKVTLETLITRARFQIESLLLSETRREPLADLLRQVPEEVPVYVAPQALMDDVAGFPIHRGILACGKKGLVSSPRNWFEHMRDNAEVAADTLLLASDISNHDNVGALFRNSAAFGADAVMLDDRCCDPLYRKAIRVSAGASLWLPYARGGSGEDMIAAAKAAGYAVWAMTPRQSATPLAMMPVPDKLAILVGAEGPGLPDALIDAATPVRIPMTPGFDSINVATAASIALSHVFNARSAE